MYGSLLFLFHLHNETFLLTLNQTMRSSTIINLSVAASAAAGTVAFVTHSQPSINAARSHSALASMKDGNEEQTSQPNAFRNFVAVSAITLGLLSPSSDALAAQDTTFSPPQNYNALQSSTVTLSEVIRTMDFSLPSSYDSIADPIAAGTEELTDGILPGGKTAPKKKAPPKKSAKPSGGGGAKGVGISMPKLDFGGSGSSGGSTDVNPNAFKPLTPEEKAAALAARRAEREEAAAQEKAESAAKEKQSREELNAKIAADRAEAIARRQEENARKAAEEQAKREKSD